MRLLPLRTRFRRSAFRSVQRWHGRRSSVSDQLFDHSELALRQHPERRTALKLHDGRDRLLVPAISQMIRGNGI